MSPAGNQSDVLVIGGGAAGLMCAIAAAQRGRRVTVLEGSNKVGKKILMSGGGRCNFTNLLTGPEHFVSANPHFCKSALSRYTQWDFIALVEKHGIPYHEKTRGQLFCDRSSKDIVALLLYECQAVDVAVLTHCENISVENKDRFRVSCSRGRFDADSLVIATGGLSIPRMGASDLGYRLARQFGLTVLDTRAALVPFTFTGKLQELMQRLSGVSCRVNISVNNVTFNEDILFTHRGLSGPAALQISSFWAPGDVIDIDLLPRDDASHMLSDAKAAVPKALLRSILAKKLARALVVELEGLMWPTSSDIPIGEFSDRALHAIATALHAWSIKPAATEGYRTAEVTSGGVDTRELSSRTMEYSKRPGLFFIGEVVDVTGHLGGYNFQWAWSSGWAAGQAV